MELEALEIVRVAAVDDFANLGTPLLGMLLMLVYIHTFSSITRTVFFVIIIFYPSIIMNM